MLAWHLNGKAVAVQSFLRLLRENKFPPRYYQYDDVSAYLLRVQDDDHLDAALRSTARETFKLFEMYESIGVLAGMRMHSASERALEVYSPRARAPVVV